MHKIILAHALFIAFCTITHAQNADFMIGTWKSRGGSTTASASITSTLLVDNVSGESFTGIKTSELNDGSDASITVSISGFFSGKELYLQNGVVQKKNGQWDDCSACTQTNKMLISHDSLILLNSVTGCNNRCDGEMFYYRLLSEYDSATQRHLLDRFGRPSDIIGFHPFHPPEKETVAPNSDDEEKRMQDSLANIARIKLQRTNDSALLAQQKKRKQEIADSLSLVKRSEQQHIQDSLDNIARIRQQQIADSTLLAQQQKRQQEIEDSLNVAKQVAKQREQQHIQDSLDNIARIRQQQIDDSTLLAQQKKRQQEITDSLNLANQKQQQHIQDSLDDIARIRQQQIADSTLLAQQKKRQQEITDSVQKVALAKATPAADSNQSVKVLTSRTSVLLGTYHISTPDILIELFDNGEIDGDRVSVYHNNAIIVSNQTLGTKPITLNIHADTANREHEFVLVAENLGSIPPNSALMRITAGKQVYKLTVNTDLKTNARIVFYYDGN